MTANYEKEQKELMQAVAEAEQRHANAEQDNVNIRAFFHHPQMHRLKGADTRTRQSADNKD